MKNQSLKDKSTLTIKFNSSGITLIALVVTIIVLMILAGVAVAILMGDNGLIKRAGEARENQRGAAVQDEVTLALAENGMIDQLNSVQGTKENKKTKRDVVLSLEEKGYLSENERKRLLGENEEEEEQDIITIGSIRIDFSQLGRAGGEDSGSIRLSITKHATESRAVLLETKIEGDEILSEAELQASSETDLRLFYVDAFKNWARMNEWPDEDVNTITWESFYEESVTSLNEHRYGYDSPDGCSSVYEFIIEYYPWDTWKPTTFECNGETITGIKAEFVITKNGSYSVIATKGTETATSIVNITNCVNRSDSQEEIYSSICSTNTRLKVGTSGRLEPATGQDVVVAVCPAGFAYGISNNVGTIEKGLVITDEVENGNSIGNEFVWIPAMEDEDGNLCVGRTGKKMSMKNGLNYVGVPYALRYDYDEDDVKFLENTYYYVLRTTRWECKSRAIYVEGLIL